MRLDNFVLRDELLNPRGTPFFGSAILFPNQLKPIDTALHGRWRGLINILMIHKELFKKFITPKSESVSENRNIVCYTRISSSSQHETSLEVQYEDIINYAKIHGYNVIANFGFTIESATEDMSRKEFKRLYDWVTTEAPQKPLQLQLDSSIDFPVLALQLSELSKT